MSDGRAGRRFHYLPKGDVLACFGGSKSTDVRVGSGATLGGGSCCLECRRYVSAQVLRVSNGNGRHILATGCPWCGRVPPEPRVLVEGVDG